MKKQALILWIVLVVLLVGGIVLTRSAVAGREAVTGGGYHLTTLNWQVIGSSNAGGYHLQSLSKPSLTGNGCCCTFLPCVKR